LPPAYERTPRSLRTPTAIGQALWGVHSQTTRTKGLRRSRYIGWRKTHLGHVAIATAVNVVQLVSWLRGDTPAQTRISPFNRLMNQAA
jgi:hypothetical protein